MKLVMATRNSKKLKELQAILLDLNIEVISEKEAGIDIEVEETGTTFEENARIKAMTVMLATGIATVADDSGLELRALGGRPGIYSARYGNVNSDEERNELLLKEMADKEDRAARFVSAVCCVFPDGKEITVRGECCGELLYEPRGSGGFGYDPLFYMPEQGMTMAELDSSMKNRVSHRAKALNKLYKELEKL